MFHFRGKASKASASVFVVLFVLGLLVGCLGTYYLNTRQISNLDKQVTDLQNQVATLSGNSDQIITINQNGTSSVEIYANVSDSVVLIQGNTTTGDVQASGFVYNYTGTMVILTNYHVVRYTTSLSVTFSNGNGYAATVLGTDPYADLAVLSVEAPTEELKPLRIVSSSNLKVGQEVIAIGNPYGLVGSLTTGVISALGRSEQAYFTSNFSLANMIQTSTPINPGNSGGPLLNAAGDVIGITNSAVSNSQGVCFAVPSNTILREISALVTEGTYNGHSYMGIHVLDMNYERAQEQNLNVTYGVWIPSEPEQDLIEPNGPSNGKLQEGDVIIALNSTRIRNNDDLASYLEEKTLPNDLLVVTVVRSNSTVDTEVTLGTRPTPNM
ncbi:MAG: trypsin-like peptidase domain-containing protein [Candidatus Bathyarchaeota archaeon]|nr:trypsin-like peptidase domain-containing protein [Candidatus Bathyarchaeota archaeon]